MVNDSKIWTTKCMFFMFRKKCQCHIKSLQEYLYQVTQQATIKKEKKRKVKKEKF